MKYVTVWLTGFPNKRRYPINTIFSQKGWVSRHAKVKFLDLIVIYGESAR